jgi:hypothetical protein
MSSRNVLVNSSQKVRIRTKPANNTYLVLFPFLLVPGGLHFVQKGGEGGYLVGMVRCNIVLLGWIDGKIVQLRMWVIAHFRSGPIFQCGLVAGLDIFPVSLDDGQGVVKILLHDVTTSGGVCTEEVVQLVAAVGSDAGGERMVQQGGERSINIDHGEERLLLAGLDALRPAYDERDACAGIEGAVLTAAVVLHGSMAVQQFAGLVLIAVVDDGAVVATEDEDGVVGQVQAVQCVHDLSDGPVQLQDDVAAGAEAALACKAGVGDAGNVDVLRTHIEEEGFVFMSRDEALGLGGDDVGDVFIGPEGGTSAGHPADAGDAVDDGIVVTLAGLHLHEFGVFEPGGPVAYFMVVADGDGVVGVEAYDAAVLHEDAGDAVYGGGDDVFVVEADVLGVGLDEAVEVGAAFRAEAEVPFADGGGGVAFCAEHIGHGDAGGIYNEFGVTGGDAGVLLSPGIHTRQQTEAGGGAGGGGGVGVGELHALAGKAVDVGGADAGGTVATQVADAQVVGYQVDDVGLLTGGVRGVFLRRGTAGGQQGGAGDQGP